jgi:hypothetical protein
MRGGIACWRSFVHRRSMNSVEPADPIERRFRRRAQNIRRAFWAGCLWLGTWLAMALEQALAWTDMQQGFVNGALMGIVFAPLAQIYLLPIGLIGRALGSIGPLKPYRWWIGLGLPLALCFMAIIPRIHERIDPTRRFERITGVRFPADARNLVTIHWGGAVDDIFDTYRFTCQPHETDRLIREFRLRQEPSPATSPINGPGGRFSPVAAGWSGASYFRSNGKVGNTGFLELFADGTGTRLRINYETHENPIFPLAFRFFRCD